MDERYLESQRRAPRAEFARDLRASLAADDDVAERPAFRAWRLLATAAALALVAGSFAFPAVRASAQNVLDFFRVREFSVVTVSESRLQELRDRHFDPASLVSGKAVTLQEPGPDRLFASVEAAAAATGLAIERPTAVPRGLALDTVTVHGETRSRATVDVRPLRDLMAAFEVNDLALPAGLDGGSVEVHVPPVVMQRFRGTGGSRVTFVQCAGPEVGMPAGVDLARLGEIGLRLSGLEAADAHRLAQRIDWRSTFLVPVVGNATSYQQVDVRGAHGVFLQTAKPPGHSGESDGDGGALLWSRDGRVYAMTSNLDRIALVQMAESVR